MIPCSCTLLSMSKKKKKMVGSHEASRFQSLCWLTFFALLLVCCFCSSLIEAVRMWS